MNQSNLVKVLTAEIERVQAEEGITPELLECVDLDIAFSPVICVRGESTRDAVTVSESNDPNRYLLSHPYYPAGWVTKDELKVMRCRFLVTRGNEMEPAMRRFMGGAR